MLYKITYNHIDIYKAIKNICTKEQWLKIQRLSNWLPQPKFNGNNKIPYQSYFTELGYNKFCKTVLPAIKEIISEEDINIEKIPESQIASDMLLYEDGFQIIYNISQNNILTEEYLQNLSEVYFGKTPLIIEMEDTLDKVRKKYRNTNQIPNADPLLRKFNKLIKEQFGLKGFSLVITFDIVPGITSTPISARLFSNDSDILLDKDSYKFKPDSKYIALINITTGLLFNNYFTTEEIMAAILYQLGYMFFSGFNKSNALLANIYTAISIATSIARTAQTVYYLRNIGNNVELVIKGMEMMDPDPLKGPPELIKYNKDIMKNMTPDELNAFLVNYANTINQRNDMINKIAHKTGTAINYATITPTILNACMQAPEFKLLVNLFKSNYIRDSKIRTVSIGFIDYIKLFFSKVLSSISNIATKAISIFGSGNRPSILDLILPYKIVINKMKNPLNWINIIPSYKVDLAANSFATMYGYGAAEISYFQKMESNNKVKLLTYFIKKHPYIGIIYDIVLLPSKILSSVFDPTPNGIARCVDQIKLLEYELTKQNIDLETKQDIMNDYKECYKMLNKLCDISRGVKDPDILKKLYNKLLYECFNSVGLKDQLLNSGSHYVN